jgi:hypothetical protein
MQKLESDCSINCSKSLVSPNGQVTLNICANGGGWFYITVN